MPQGSPWAERKGSAELHSFLEAPGVNLLPFLFQLLETSLEPYAGGHKKEG